MAIAIPNPIRIACTECHQDMRIEHQSTDTHYDSLCVAAECDCGRVFGEIAGELIVMGWGTKERPIIAHALRHNPELGANAKTQIDRLRERMAVHERTIAVATWARQKLRKEPG